MDEKYMLRAIELARNGIKNVAPNPMVGCVIVFNEIIIGEGFHQKYGEPHAEVNAINSVTDHELLKKSTLYVTLEPCAHYGLTPPCSDLIVEKQIQRVVIGTTDPFAEVAGKGIQKLQKAGINVKVGILEDECRDLNKRFFTFHERKRPFTILKWAQTNDGFIDIDRQKDKFGEPTWITGDLALLLVHKIRSEESAILVGRKTVEKDNPSLTVRHWSGKNPLRILLDRNLTLKKDLNLFDHSNPTIVFNSKTDKEENNLQFVKLDFSKNIVQQILNELYRRKVLSVIVEGGKQLLESFIEADLWDEAHIFIGNRFFYSGVRAPELQGKIVFKEILDDDKLFVLRNQSF